MGGLGPHLTGLGAKPLLQPGLDRPQGVFGPLRGGHPPEPQPRVIGRGGGDAVHGVHRADVLTDDYAGLPAQPDRGEQSPGRFGRRGRPVRGEDVVGQQAGQRHVAARRCRLGGPGDAGRDLHDLGEVTPLPTVPLGQVDAGQGEGVGQRVQLKVVVGVVGVEADLAGRGGQGGGAGGAGGVAVAGLAQVVGDRGGGSFDTGLHVVPVAELPADGGCGQDLLVAGRRVLPGVHSRVEHPAQDIAAQQGALVGVSDDRFAPELGRAGLQVRVAGGGGHRGLRDGWWADGAGAASAERAVYTGCTTVSGAKARPAANAGGTCAGWQPCRAASAAQRASVSTARSQSAGVRPSMRTDADRSGPSRWCSWDSIRELGGPGAVAVSFVEAVLVADAGGGDQPTDLAAVAPVAVRGQVVVVAGAGVVDLWREVGQLGGRVVDPPQVAQGGVT